MSSNPELAISTDKICSIVTLVQEFDARDSDGEPHAPEEFAEDDDQISVLEGRPDDHTEQELHNFIGGLDEDEQIDLVALAWLGRGDGDISDWASIRADAAAAHNNRTADYLLGIPLLGDYLEEGLNAFGLSCEE
jgi:hypothetical protein